MKKLFATCCLLLCAFMSFAQEGTYVVTKKAPKEIPVMNYDGEVIGHLRRGDKVYVSEFNQPQIQEDPSVISHPITFISYKGHTGLVRMESPEWMECIKKVTWSAEDEAAAHPLGTAGHSTLFWVCALYILLLLVIAKPFNVIIWELRELPASRGISFLLGLGLLAAIGLEVYYFLTAENPFWFCQWGDVGILQLIVGFILGTAMLAVKFMALSFIVCRLANMQRQRPGYFNYSLAIAVTFIGTWLLLIVNNWSVDFREYVFIALIVALAGYIIYASRNVFRARGLLTGLLVVLLILAGVSTLCFVSLEIFRRILQIVVAIWIIRCFVSAAGTNRMNVVDNGPISYLDPETGQVHQLFKEGSNFKDYSDGSVWGRGSNPNSFNRFQ